MGLLHYYNSNSKAVLPSENLLYAESFSDKSMIEKYIIARARNIIAVDSQGHRIYTIDIIVLFLYL